MATIKELITRFWQGKLNAQEMIRLEQLLAENNPLLSEQFKADYEALLASGEILEQLGPSSSARILKTLQQRIALEQPEAKPTTFRLLPVMKWAACLILIAFAVFLSTYQKKGQVVQTLSSTAKPAGKTYLNNQEADIRIVLPDASIVTLAPKSKLDYQVDFGQVNRNVYLEGKAEFKVAKNAGKPFSVYAGQVATTALGTRFTVNTFKKNQVQVKLLEGRVVVHTADKGNFAMLDTYLKPGDQLGVDQRTGSLNLQKNQSLINDKPSRATVPKNTLEFKQENLVAVMKQLEDHYHQHIDFNENELSGLSFTGNIRERDELKDILTVLCTMNGLDFTEKDHKITIRKQKN